MAEFQERLRKVEIDMASHLAACEQRHKAVESTLGDMGSKIDKVAERTAKIHTKVSAYDGSQTGRKELIALVVSVLTAVAAVVALWVK